MDNTKNTKTTFFVYIFLRAIMGRGEQTEDTILEVLADSYTHEKIQAVISDFDEVLISNILAILAGNGTVCDVLNSMPGSAGDKQRIIINRLWNVLIESQIQLKQMQKHLR